jgi:hypothetical protein
MAWSFYNSSGKLIDGVLDSSITNAKMVDDAIDSDEIVAGAVDLAHMSANSIDSTQYVDGSIDTAHIAASQITNALMADNAIDSAELAAGSVDTAHIAASQITNALMADDAIGIAELSATGTASSSTFLRGDNAWAATGVTDISCRIHTTQAQVLVDGTEAAVIFEDDAGDNNSYDTDNMHHHSTYNTRITFTTAGKYFGAFNVEFQNASGGERRLQVRVNGGSGTRIGKSKLSYPDGNDHDALQVVWNYEADAGDYIECWAYQNSGADKNINWDGISYPHGWATRIPGS